MASITMRNLDEALGSRLRVRAAIHRRSMEDEARIILRDMLSAEAVEAAHIGSVIHGLFAPLGGMNLTVINREPMREPPGFET